MTQCRHALTIDVEDYYQVAAFFGTVDAADWGKWPSRVERNTDRLLALLAERDTKATFFILGKIAEAHPALIQRIHAAGHELASHGYSHEFIYRQTPATFAEETRRAKQLVEDLIGAPLTGYRAASYSITAASLWAIEILIEAGFVWDSSIFPTRHDHYGLAHSPREPYYINTPSGRILECPLTTVTIAGLQIPAAGGGYFRQYPYALSRWLFARASANNTRPQIFYLHPWEIDPEQPRIPNARLLSRFRHYTNLDKTEPRLRRLLQDFDFTSMSDSLLRQPIEVERSLQQLQNLQENAR